MRTGLRAVGWLHVLPAASFVASESAHGRCLATAVRLCLVLWSAGALAANGGAEARGPVPCAAAEVALEPSGGAPITALDARGGRWLAGTASGELIVGRKGAEPVRRRLGAKIVEVKLGPAQAWALDERGVLHALAMEDLAPTRRWGAGPKEDRVTSFAPGTDGSVAVGGKKGSLQLWTKDAARPSWSRRVPGTVSYGRSGALAPVSGIAFSRDGRFLAAGQLLHVSTLRVKDGEILSIRKLPSKVPITHVTFFPEDRLVGALTYTDYVFAPFSQGRLGLRWFEVTRRGFTREPFAVSEDGRIVTLCQSCEFAGDPRMRGERKRYVIAAPPRVLPSMDEAGRPNSYAFRRLHDVRGLKSEVTAVALSKGEGPAGALVLLAGSADGEVLRCHPPLPAAPARTGPFALHLSLIEGPGLRAVLQNVSGSPQTLLHDKRLQPSTLVLMKEGVAMAPADGRDRMKFDNTVHASDFRTLAEGAQIELETAIIRHAPDGYSLRWGPWRFDRLQPGRYTVRVEFESARDEWLDEESRTRKKKELWRGRVVSETLVLDLPP